MQGRKDIYPKMINKFNIEEMVSTNYFYRILNKELVLSYLNNPALHYYSDKSQKSINPVIIFNICMVYSLNNISAQSSLIKFSKNDCLAKLLNFKYNIEEPLLKYRTIISVGQLYSDAFCRCLLINSLQKRGGKVINILHFVIIRTGIDYVYKPDSQCYNLFRILKRHYRKKKVKILYKIYKMFDSKKTVIF